MLFDITITGNRLARLLMDTVELETPLPPDSVSKEEILNHQRLIYKSRIMI